MEEVNLRFDREENAYQDLDNPDTWWQLVCFSDDMYDCIVCGFPIDVGSHFGCLDDTGSNAHYWCASVEK